MKLLNFCALFASTISALTLPNVHPRPQHPHLSWSLKPTNSTKQFRGLSPVSSKVVWVAGAGGTVLRTVDGGVSWANISPTSTAENLTALEFRDIQAWSTKTAVILSIGPGNESRILVTNDGGKKWQQTFVNEDPSAFYDCMAFENNKHGLALSDPVNGKFRLLETWNGGSSWSLVDPAGIPPALTNEAGFAASGTCIEAAAGRWYIASGGADPGRVYRSDDGHCWKTANTTIPGDPASGVFSVRFRDAKHGIAVGGNYTNANGNVNNAAWSRDGGVTWETAETFPGGYRSGAAWVPGRSTTAIAVGTSGSDFTVDGGKSWHGIDNGTFDAVECVNEDVCWASGAKGRVARLDLS